MQANHIYQPSLRPRPQTRHLTPLLPLLLLPSLSPNSMTNRRPRHNNRRQHRKRTIRRRRLPIPILSLTPKKTNRIHAIPSQTRRRRTKGLTRLPVSFLPALLEFLFGGDFGCVWRRRLGFEFPLRGDFGNVREVGQTDARGRRWRRVGSLTPLRACSWS